MIHRLRRTVILAALFFPGLMHSGLSEDASKKSLIWHSVSDSGVEGQGWPAEDLSARFDRLPAKAEKVVREKVWGLSRTSSGMMFRFNTDATEISMHYTLGSDKLDLPHMPATGASGVDLYALDSNGNWKWVSVPKPTGTDVTHSISGIDPGMRTYMAYLPLRNSILSLEIGVPEGSKFQPVAPRAESPIVFYGTSITHGACASRPGMSHVAILGRRLNRPVINLGFAGAGTMDMEVGALLTEIDAAVYIIDCLPNMNSGLVAERTEPLVNQLRQARPDTPIILIEDRTFTNAWLFKAKRDHHRESRASLVRAYDNLITSGIQNLYYLKGEDLLGSDTEGATDGSHPSDLGFVRQADAFEPVLREALGID